MSVAPAVKFVCPGLVIVLTQTRYHVSKPVLRVKIIISMLNAEVVYVVTMLLIFVIITADRENQKSRFNVTAQAVLSI